MYYLQHATPEYITGAFTYGGVHYPANWPNLVEMGAVPAPTFDPVTQTLNQTGNPAAPFLVVDHSLSELRAQALAEIDAAAGAARGRYITTVPGQETTYTEKEKEARAHADGAAGPFPFLEAEAAELNSSVPALAAEVIATADAWRTLAPIVEAKRRGGKVAVEAASAAAAIQAAKAAAVAALNAI